MRTLKKISIVKERDLFGVKFIKSGDKMLKAILCSEDKEVELERSKQLSESLVVCDLSRLY